MKSGHETKRIQCVTHNTKRALVQTIEELIAVCKQLFSVGFGFVLLCSKLKENFLSKDNPQKRLWQLLKPFLFLFAASFLESVEAERSNKKLTFVTIQLILKAQFQFKHKSMMCVL